MKKLAIVFIGLFLITFSVGVNAQNPTASDNAVANATIISPIAISNVQSLEFGNIIADADGGTVAIATDGTPTLTGVNAPSVNGTRQQATFTVTGLSDATYAVTLPTSVSIDDGGSNSMTVDNFVSDPNATGTLTGGTETLNVGATLNVAASQAAGTYSGSFTVTVAYN